MQKTLTPPHPSEDDCFADDADDAVEDADADDLDLMGGSEEELQQLSC